MKFNFYAFKSIYLHEMDRFRRTLTQSLLSPVLSTSLYFIVFGLSKIIDLKNFPKSFAMYDPIASNFSFYGWAYPFVELALGVMFIAQFFPFVAIVSTIILLSVETFAILSEHFTIFVKSAA